MKRKSELRVVHAAVNSALSCSLLSSPTLQRLEQLKAELQGEIDALSSQPEASTPPLAALTAAVQDVDVKSQIDRLTRAAASIEALSRKQYISEGALVRLRSILLDLDKEIMQAIRT